MRGFKKTMSFVLTVLLFPCISFCQSLDPAPFEEPVKTGEFGDRRIDEASGIAPSRINDDLLWVVNDGGSGPRIFASDLTGKALSSFLVKDAKNKDWEDLASFVIQGRPFLLIADVGDNHAVRESCALYFVEEPRAVANGLSERETEIGSRKVKFVYEDGPRDCESVAVDLKSMRVFIVTKRKAIPILYSLPLLVGGSDRTMTARRSGEIPHIPPPGPRDLLEDPVFGAYSSQVTAMDIDSSGRYAVLLTYRTAYWFHKAAGEMWERVLSKTPRRIDIPKLSQAEAICFSRDDSELFLTSEKLPSPIYRIPMKNENFSDVNFSERSEGRIWSIKE